MAKQNSKSNSHSTGGNRVLKKEENEKIGSDNIVYFLLAILCIIFIKLCFDVQFLQDDSFISFRFVKNFVQGYGLVFNPGEHVEGYTCLLWVLLLSVFYAAKFSLENVSQYLSLAFGLASLVFTFFLSRSFIMNDNSAHNKSKVSSEDRGILKYSDLLPMVLLIFTGAFNFWAISGMETTMFIAFVLMSVFYYIKIRKNEVTGKEVPAKLYILLPFFLVLASLTRPEGMYFFGLIVLHKIIIAIKEHKKNAFKEIFSKKNILIYAIYIVPVAIHMIIRLLYYGYPFPNTAYAKTGISSVYLSAGIDYFIGFYKAYMLYGLIVLLPLFLFKRKENFFEVSLYYLLIVFYTIYIVTVGGDVLKQYRFFLPILPFIYILFTKFLVEMYYKLKTGMFGGKANPAFLVITVIALIIGYYNFSSEKEKIAKDVETENGLVDKMKITAGWFKTKQQQAGRPLTVAATTIGAISYYSDVIVIDMLGLTDATVAHNPVSIPEISQGNIGWKERNYNVGYILSRKPDYMYFSTGIKPSAYAERALFTDQEFIKYYFPYYFTIPGMQFQDCVYKRKSEEEIKEFPLKANDNPNYRKNYVNEYTYGMNVSRDKSKSKEALEAFQRCLVIAPGNFSYVYNQMADIYFRDKNNEEAIKNLEKAVSIDPTNVLAQGILYQVYVQKNDTVNSARSLNIIKKLAPDMMGK
ncbi:hypothetical protein BH10BAC5_BH10BAC5_01850 [soil metagenome]